MSYESSQSMKIIIINGNQTHPVCFPPPAFLFHEPNIACMTIRGMESGSVQDAPLKAIANCARGISSSIILTWFWYKGTSQTGKGGKRKEKKRYCFNGEPNSIHVPTSEPVKIAGSFATSWVAVIGLSDNFVNKLFTFKTKSSCLTAPEATITWDRSLK